MMLFKKNFETVKYEIDKNFYLKRNLVNCNENIYF